MDRGYLDEHPLTKLGRFDTTPQSERRTLTPDEVKRLLACCAPARELDLDLKAAGIPKSTARGKIAFHALHNATTTMTIEAGASVKKTQTLARHASPALTFNVYARTREKRLSAMAETLAGPEC